MNEHDRLYIIQRDDCRYDVRKLDATALEELEMLLQSDITTIRDQVVAAQNRRRETGVFANADWFRRARKAQGIKARQLETVKRFRKEARIRERREAGNAFPSYFMDAAREVLSNETFNVVMSRAAMMQAAEVVGKS